jgi:hypothetical protein
MSAARRHLLQTSAVLLGLSRPLSSLAQSVPDRVLRLPAPSALAALLRTDEALLAVGVHGDLWRHQLDVPIANWTRLADALDPQSPLAAAHGRIGARGARGELVMVEAGKVTRSAAQLSRHAGLLVLPAGVIAVVRGGGDAFVARFEPTGGRWTEVARSREPVLPDAQPAQFDPRGRGDDTGGHVAILAGPDAQRYGHAVLGDGIEATRVLWLERHALTAMAALTLPAPHVFEDRMLRPIAFRDGRALLTVRAGPQGAQLVLLAPAGIERPLVIVAAGPPIGTTHRWMAPVGGDDLLAVHMPHIAGRLHRYRIEGDRLFPEHLVDGVSNHALGSRDLDTSVHLGDVLALPTLERRGVAFVAMRDARWTRTDLDVHVSSLTRWSLQGAAGVLALDTQGQLHWVRAP